MELYTQFALAAVAFALSAVIPLVSLVQGVGKARQLNLLNGLATKAYP
jgi:hypothetical protein